MKGEIVMLIYSASVCISVALFVYILLEMIVDEYNEREELQYLQDELDRTSPRGKVVQAVFRKHNEQIKAHGPKENN